MWVSTRDQKEEEEEKKKLGGSMLGGETAQCLEDWLLLKKIQFPVPT